MNKLITIILTTLTISTLAQEQDAKEILDKLAFEYIEKILTLKVSME